MENKTVYACGPITGLMYTDAVEWREKAQKLVGYKITIVSPMRHKAYLSKETALQDHYKQTMSTPKGITVRDRWDVSRCDLLLANFLGATRVSIGSVLEIAWADAWGKPIVLVMDYPNVHDHGMIKTLAGFIVPTLEEAADVIRAILL